MVADRNLRQDIVLRDRNEDVVFRDSSGGAGGRRRSSQP